MNVYLAMGEAIELNHFAANERFHQLRGLAKVEMVGKRQWVLALVCRRLLWL